MPRYQVNSRYFVFWNDGDYENYKQNRACFSNIIHYFNKMDEYSNKVVKKVQFTCPIDKSLSSECVNFYLKFLGQLLNESLVKYKIKQLTTGRYLFMILDCQKLNYHKPLLYLTAYRYLNEFPEIVNEFLKYKDISDIRVLFKKFQYIHFLFVNGSLELKKYNNLPGHGLIYQYVGSMKNFKYITLREFKKKLNNENFSGNVQSHFIPTPKPKRVKKKVDKPANNDYIERVNNEIPF